jgi:hypothetical protein
MANESQKGNGPEVRGEEGEAVAGVRSQSTDLLLNPNRRRVIATLITNLQEAERSASEIASSVIDGLEELAQNISDSIKESSPGKEIALLLLRAVQLLRKVKPDQDKISAIQKVARLFYSHDLNGRHVKDADGILNGAGLNALDALSGLSALYNDGGDDGEEKGEAVAGVSAQAAEAISSKITDLCALFEGGIAADGKFDQPTLHCLNSLAQAISDSWSEPDVQQDMAILLLGAVQSLSISESSEKIQVIIDGFRLLNGGDITSKKIAEINRRLIDAGFNIIGKGDSFLFGDLTAPTD